MKIDLTSLLEGKTSEIPINYTFTPDGEDALLPHGIT